MDTKNKKSRGSSKNVTEILKNEYPYLKDNFGVKRIGLFGSYAKGTATKNSDVDIVIEFNRPIGLKFIELAEYLERRFGRKADILTLDGIETIRIKEVAADIKRSLLYV